MFKMPPCAKCGRFHYRRLCSLGSFVGQTWLRDLGYEKKA